MKIEGRKKSEKPVEVIVPFKRATSVDRGVQTPEITYKVIEKFKDTKVLRNISHTPSDM